MGNYEPLQAPMNNQPPARPQPHLRAVSPTDTPAMVPGGALRRFFAVLIDNMILNVALLPIAIGANMLVLTQPATSQGQLALVPALINLGASLIISFFYYGWFYRNKGGSPGKLVLGLRVVNAETGTTIGYWQAFFRETIGRIVDVLPLCAGLFVGLFRSDKRCFHDLLAKTQVIVRK